MNTRFIECPGCYGDRRGVISLHFDDYQECPVCDGLGEIETDDEEGE